MKLKGSAIKRFDDSLLFTDLEDNRIKSHVTGPSSGFECSTDERRQAAVIGIPPGSSIRIDRAWDVRSEEAGHLDRELMDLNTKHSNATMNDRMTGTS